jgi:hypothetical protein
MLENERDGAWESVRERVIERKREKVEEYYSKREMEIIAEKKRGREREWENVRERKRWRMLEKE